MSKTLTRKLLPIMLALAMMVMPLASVFAADVASATDLNGVEPVWECESWEKTYDGKGVTPSATIPVGTLDKKTQTTLTITIKDASGKTVNAPVVNAGVYTVSAKVTYGTIASDERKDYEFPTKKTLTIKPKPVTLKADPASKNYGASDPENLTATAEGLVSGDKLNYTVTRAKGEKIGDYDITITLGENPNYDVTATGATFTINPKFAGSISVANDTVTNRTDEVGFTVSGISADLSEDITAVLKVKAKAKGASKGATIEDVTIKGNTDSNSPLKAKVTGVILTDKTSSLNYFAYLPAGDYDLVLTMPSKDGTVDDTVGTLTITADSVSASVKNNNSANDERNLIGAESKDTLSFTLGDYIVRKMGDSDQEIVKLNVTVNGKSIYSKDKYVEAVAAGDTIASDLASYIPSGVHTAKVDVTAEVVSPDLTPTTVTRNFIYDAYALAIPDENIQDLDNRTTKFTVKLPERGEIVSATLTGFNVIRSEDIDHTTEKNSDGNEVTTATIRVGFNTANLPKADSVETTIEYKDYAGNAKTYTATGVKQATVKPISLSNIEPMTIELDDNSRLVKGTNILRLSGFAVGYERLNISFTAPNGFSYGNAVTVEGNGVYNNQAQDYWQAVIGDRTAEDNLELPMGVPITMKINYADVSGGGVKMTLRYDDICQEAMLLTPAYPGMTIMTGFAESVSKVTATWSNGSVDAVVSPQGFFIINFPEGIFDPEITLTITDIAGNTVTQTIEVPGRSRDVNMVVNAYPVGAVIQDDTGMPKFIASSVDLEALAEGPVELPILAANYFKVGTMTISLGEDGTVAFQPAIAESNAADGASYFNIYTNAPAADALNEENRGNGMDITAGFKPEEGTTKFWFVYETPATLTDAMLTQPESVETIGLDNTDFLAFQQND